MPNKDHLVRITANMRIIVMGLGRFGGGVGVSRWLCQQRCKVSVTDMEKDEALADSVQQLSDCDIAFHLGGHPESILDDADLLVVNPAVDKNKSAFVQAARRRGIAITTEINLFVQRCRAPIVGITGSVGKSTTTAMIHRALSACLTDAPPRRCWMGGNIGQSLLADLPHIQPPDIVVLELSSFMLEDTPAVAWSPQVAVVTNLVPNHLDRHGTMDEYAAIKKNILRFQGPLDTAIINAEDAVVSSWLAEAKGKKMGYCHGQQKKLKLLVPGDHNQSNARAALAVVEALGFSPQRQTAIEALERFSGLPHRLELVHSESRPDGHIVRWFNDSKATSPDAAMTALKAFPERSFICIVGGYDKHLDLTNFAATLAQRAGGVLGIGATGAELIRLVSETGLLHSSRRLYVETLSAAIQHSRIWLNEAPAGGSRLESVLLSPGCASYDQFRNYEKRGEMFATLAKIPDLAP